MTEHYILLDEEVEAWEGFPKVMRAEDRELFKAMVVEIRNRYGEAIEKSGRPLTVDPFFMALLLGQQRTIKTLTGELKALRGGWDG